jgi:hypothetical protein
MCGLSDDYARSRQNALHGAQKRKRNEQEGEHQPTNQNDDQIAGISGPDDGALPPPKRRGPKRRGGKSRGKALGMRWLHYVRSPLAWAMRPQKKSL